MPTPPQPQSAPRPSRPAWIWKRAAGGRHAATAIAASVFAIIALLFMIAVFLLAKHVSSVEASAYDACRQDLEAYCSGMVSNQPIARTALVLLAFLGINTLFAASRSIPVRQRRPRASPPEKGAC